MGPLHTLVALLRLDRERGDRPGLEPAQADRLRRILAISVGAVLDPLQRIVDLGDQLALAISGSEFQRSIRLPETINEDKAEARFDKGVLTITLPKRPEMVGAQKKIEIKGA